MRRTAKLNPQTEFTSFRAAHLGSNKNQDMVEGISIQSSRSVYAPHLIQSMRLCLFKCIRGDNAHKMIAAAVQWELRGTNIRDVSRICKIRLIMGIMSGLLGCCSSSTFGSRANDYVKSLATLGFWLHHSLAPSGVGRSTPSQPGHYPLSVNNEWCDLPMIFTHDFITTSSLTKIIGKSPHSWPQNSYLW